MRVEEQAPPRSQDSGTEDWEALEGHGLPLENMTFLVWGFENLQTIQIGLWKSEIGD